MNEGTATRSDPRGVSTTAWFGVAEAAGPDDTPRYGERVGLRDTVLVTQRTREARHDRAEYKLLAASRSTTIEKDLGQAALAGFEVVTAAEGGSEFVVIVKRARPRT